VCDLQPISAKYVLGSLIKASDEIHLYAIAFQRNCAELGTKTRIAPTEATGFYSFDIHLVCAEYAVEALGVTSIEVRLMAFYIKSKCIVVSVDTWLSTSGEIRIFTNGLLHDIAEYVLQTCFSPTEGGSDLTLHIQLTCVE
jgi:hypothetical protein